MYEMPKIRDIDRLAPAVAEIARKWLHIVREDLGIDARIVETLRDPSRQKQLQEEGKSNVKMGWHQVGMAWDYLCFDNCGRIIGDGEDEVYTRCGHIAQALGCKWPIYIRRGVKDAGHIEHHPGFTLQQFLSSKNYSPEPTP